MTGTPVDLAHLIPIEQPVRHASYELRETGSVGLREVLAPIIERC